MSFRRLVLLYFVALTLVEVVQLVENFWTYELISMKTYSNDTSLVEVDAKIDRVGRSNIHYTGYFHIKTELDDSVLFEQTFYRSATSNMDFRQLPFLLRNDSIFKVLNSGYKDYIMDGMKGCSNLPQIDDKLLPPLPPKNYTIDKCTFSMNNFNINLPRGYYKTIIIGSGKVNWLIEVVILLDFYKIF